MNRPLILCLALLGAGHGFAANKKAAAPAPPAAGSAATAPSFEAFRLIGDRNIFNPNRTGRRDRTAEEPAPRLDVISLVGTMDSDRGLRAFFDGSAAAFRKALTVGGSIDKFTVTKVAAQGAELEREGKTMSVSVGQQLRRPEGGDWTLIAADVVRSEAAAAAKATAGKFDPSAPVVIPANASELERKMMERRNKDLQP
ncbi:MAG: hypothetical protein EXS32_06345 [Opitutus sp.]|nr:hypothetical protein [Opitutus sp.]